jgi:hypothetical protein
VELVVSCRYVPGGLVLTGETIVSNDQWVCLLLRRDLVGPLPLRDRFPLKTVRRH